MRNTLLYIYPQTFGENPETNTYAAERAIRRAAVAEGLGYGVVKLADVVFMAVDAEQEVMSVATGEDCVGVWIDMNPRQVNGPAGRIIQAAIKADKPLVGDMPDDQIDILLGRYIGLPESENRI